MVSSLKGYLFFLRLNFFWLNLIELEHYQDIFDKGKIITIVQ